MKTIYEYLISKDNKENIKFSLNRSDLKTGDIVRLSSRKLFCVIREEDFSKFKKLFKDNSYVQNRCRCTRIGILINITPHEINGRNITIFILEDYNNNLKFSNPNWASYNIDAIYPGEIKLNDISELFTENIEKEAYKRKILLPEWKI